MDDALEQLIRQRAKSLCEYCQLPQKASRLRFSVDHIIARQHNGATDETNLALACPFCNRHKGPNIAGIDPLTRQLTRLFHPRRDPWRDHSRWQGVTLVGLTDVGRATIAVLAINDQTQIAIRNALAEEGS